MFMHTAIIALFAVIFESFRNLFSDAGSFTMYSFVTIECIGLLVLVSLQIVTAVRLTKIMIAIKRSLQ